jgi:hypothetical protein
MLVPRRSNPSEHIVAERAFARNAKPTDYGSRLPLLPPTLELRGEQHTICSIYSSSSSSKSESYDEDESSIKITARRGSTTTSKNESAELLRRCGHANASKE